MLPLLCLSCMNPNIYIFRINFDDLNTDCIEIMNILENFNIKYYFKNENLIIDSTNITIRNNLKLESNIRAIYYFYSVLSNYQKEITFPKPKGCDIGDRKIDIHLALLKKFGIKVVVNNDNLKIDYTNKLKNINLDFTFNKISVGATINSIYLSLFNKGTITLNNCSIDPYIINIIEVLRSFNIDINLIDRKIVIKPSVFIQELPTNQK